LSSIDVPSGFTKAGDIKPITKEEAEMNQEYDVVVIGTGFGGTMTALTIAEKLKDKKNKPKILMLERGTWWTTPTPTVQDKAVATHSFLKNKHHQPVQYWNSVDHIKGLIDLILRCFRRPSNLDGLYELTQLGRRGFLGLGRKNDGVTVLRASGVGGGSLVYSNITTAPPDFIFDDPRWQALNWTSEERKEYYNLARDAIGYGVVETWRKKAGDPNANIANVNAGLSNIATRSARLNPQWKIVGGIKRIRFPDLNDPTKETPDQELRSLIPNDLQVRSLKQNRYWIDRTRVFQTAILTLTNDFGMVDSSINDITPEGTPLNPLSPSKPINYCERQGRCNVGCLPGARHTLNKQLMSAIFGKIDGTEPLFNKKEDLNDPSKMNLQLQALAEVNIIRALPDKAGYEVEYWQRDEKNPAKKTVVKVKAKRVIVAAGCLGTNEILLRSKERGGLPHLSGKLGSGFSTNGDYIAFLEDLEVKLEDGTIEKMPVSLTRGPVTTSFGHFNTPEAKLNSEDKIDTAKFHIIEDQGIPKVLASTTGFGVPFARKLMMKSQNLPGLFVLWLIGRWLWNKLGAFIKAIFKASSERQEFFKSEDELTNNMMCIVAQGREASVGQFRLGKKIFGETPLRVARTDGLPFAQDPIFTEISNTLDRLAVALGSKSKFINPLLGNVAEALKAESIATSHPLGGCAIGKNAAEGVVDEFGRVFADTGTGATPEYYDGLYIADASIFPTALGVNPSLTISALALRIGENIAKEMDV